MRIRLGVAEWDLRRGTTTSVLGEGRGVGLCKRQHWQQSCKDKNRVICHGDR